MRMQCFCHFISLKCMSEGCFSWTNVDPGRSSRIKSWENTVEKRIVTFFKDLLSWWSSINIDTEKNKNKIKLSVIKRKAKKKLERANKTFFLFIYFGAIQDKAKTECNTFFYF